MQSLSKLVAVAGAASRRKAVDLIRAGRVKISGRVVLNPALHVDPEAATITLDGRPLRVEPRVYLLMNKPAGVLSAVSDTRGRQTVADIVPERLRAVGLHPVGRLDRDTTGLLLLTNDGDLTYRLTHPRYEVEKEYWLAVEGELTDDQVEALGRGVEIDGSVRAPVAVRRLEDAEPYQLAVIIKEGRRRQVRRMLAAVGADVQLLRRVREGSLRLGDLPTGAVRPLSDGEMRLLRPKSRTRGRPASKR